jgi:hypothetical protein
MPNVTGSLFDTKTSPITVTISNNSVFAPSATNVQTGFRRLELVPASNNGNDSSSVGVKTLHWSIMKDPIRPINLTHEYQVVFMEDAAFSTNQFNLRTGNLLDVTVANPDMLNVFGNANFFKSPPALLFSTPFTNGVFHNFAMMLDFTKK